MTGAEDGAADRLRAMKESDIVTVMAMARDLPEAPQWTATMWRAMLADADLRRVMLVAEVLDKDEGERGLVGFSVASVVVELAELESMGVRREAQRRGIGRRLLMATMAACVEAGAERMMLEVRASNSAAARLYADAGFAVTGRRAGYYRDPVEDAVCMECALAGLQRD